MRAARQNLGCVSNDDLLTSRRQSRVRAHGSGALAEIHDREERPEKGIDAAACHCGRGTKTRACALRSERAGQSEA